MSTVLTVEERKQAASLHHRKVLGESLTEGEEQLVAAFHLAVEAEEAARLQPVRERQERHIAELDSQIHDMQTLLQREVAFLQRLQTTLEEIARERLEIQREKQRILSRTPVANG